MDIQAATTKTSIRLPKRWLEKAVAIAERDAEPVSVVLRRWLRAGQSADDAPAETAA